MLTVGTGPDGFPLDIFTANIVASFLLGLGFSLHSRKVLNDGLYVLI
jgi:CrcB protein